MQRTTCVYIYLTVVNYPLFFNSATRICENPEAQISDSVIVSGYTDSAVEGTTVTFHCPPGLVLDGINSSMCMENGEWEPALFEINCLGTIQRVLHT